MDEKLRNSERNAANGDPEAEDRYHRQLRRIALGGSYGAACALLDRLQGDELFEFQKELAPPKEKQAKLFVFTHREYTDDELRATSVWAALNEDPGLKLLGREVLFHNARRLIEKFQETMRQQRKFLHQDGCWQWITSA